MPRKTSRPYLSLKALFENNEHWYISLIVHQSSIHKWNSGILKFLMAMEYIHNYGSLQFIQIPWNQHLLLTDHLQMDHMTKETIFMLYEVL